MTAEESPKKRELTLAEIDSMLVTEYETRTMSEILKDYLPGRRKKKRKRP
jgi:hypothetical protein